MKTRLSAFVCYVWVTIGSLAVTLNLPPGLTPIAWQYDLSGSGGNTLYNVFQNDILNGYLLDGDEAWVPSTNCGSFTIYVVDTTAPELFDDVLANPVIASSIYVSPTAGVLASDPLAGLGLWLNNIYGATQVHFSGNAVIPQLPLALNCPCGTKYLLCSQNDIVASFQDITGVPPQEGSQFGNWTGSGFNYATYTAGAWTPATPSAAVGEAVSIVMAPCFTNGCLALQCPTNLVATGCTNVPVQVFYSPTVIASCSNTVTVICTPPSGSYFTPGTTTPVHCLALDNLGNAATCDFDVTVVLGTGLVVSCSPDKTAPCGTNVTFDPPTAFSCCGTNVTITDLGVFTNNSPCQRSLQKVWRVTDSCSNLLMCTQTVTLVSSPVLHCGNPTIPCTAPVPTNAPPVTGTCCTNPTVTLVSSVTNSGGCGKVISRTWLAVDCCSNFATCTQTVTIVSSVSLLCSNLTLPCGSPLLTNPPAFVDPCCTNVTVSLLSSVSNGIGCPVVVTQTWQALDLCCSNTATCTRTVTLQDTNPPCCPDTGGVKYQQPPDLNNGIDVIANFLPWDPINVAPWELADDFPCTNSGPITDIHLWGSWLGDQIDPGAIFTLSIWSDAPTNSGNPYSHPSALLWTQSYSNGQYTVCLYTNRLETFADTFQGAFGSTSNLFYLCFNALPGNIFYQTGTQAAPTNYWLSVTVRSANRFFGWKSSSVAYNDAAVSANSYSLYPQAGEWYPATDLQNLPLNLAFKITTSTNTCPPPVLLCTNVTVPCASAVPTNAPGYIDPCCNNVVVSLLDSATNGTGCSQTIYQTWQAVDTCYNTSTICTQVVTVTGPGLSLLCSNTTIQCGSPLPTNPPAWSDPCCTNVNVSLIGLSTNGSGCSQTILETWFATDCCNNSTTCTQTVSVVSVPPVFQCWTNVELVSCTNVPVFYAVTATNACCTNINVVCTPPSGTFFVPGTTTNVHCVATNCCGQSNSCDFTVTVLPCCGTVVNGGFDVFVPSVGTGGGWTSLDVFGSGLGGWISSVGNPAPSFLLNETGTVGQDPTVHQLVCCLTNGDCYTIHGQIKLQAYLSNPQGLPSFGVLLDGHYLAKLNLAATNTGWRDFAVDFTATNSCQDIGFAAELDPTDVSYYLDNVWLEHHTNNAPCSCLHIACATNVTVYTCSNSAVVSYNVTATNLCNANPVTVISVPPSPGPFPLGTTTVNSTAQDSAGHLAWCSFTVTVLPDPAPLSVSCASDKTVPCGTNITFDPPSASSCCGTNITITPLVPATNGPLCSRTVTETWIISDACGHSTQCVQHVTVSNAPPTLTCSNLNLTCGAPIPYVPPTYYDPCCTNTNSVAITIFKTFTNSLNPLQATRQWKITDCCGHTNICAQLITWQTTPPANDECLSPVIVTLGSYCGTTRCATPSAPGALSPAPNPNSVNSADVWYQFTPQCDGQVTIHTCGSLCPNQSGSFDTVLSVYTGKCGATLQQVPGGYNDNALLCVDGTKSRVSFAALACVSYWIRVAGHNGLVGDFKLTISQTITAPTNDLCANAIPVVNGTYHFSTCGAHNEITNAPGCPIFNDVWFRYVTPPCGGPVTINTCGSCVDTVLAVYTGVCSNLTLLQCNDNATTGLCSGTLNSAVSFTATAGATYYIRVGTSSIGLTGGGLLTISGPVQGTCPPASGPCYTRTFAIYGTANNTRWSWSIDQGCCASVSNTNVPGLPVGSSAYQLAVAFANSINAACPGGGIVAAAQAPIVPWMPPYLKICVRSCTNTPTPFVFRVGPAGAPPSSQCVVLSSSLSTYGPCSFNPDITELPMSNQDLNGNGEDDALDIFFGTSLDLNQNGIPDEVEPCVAPLLADYPDSQTVELGSTVVLSASAYGSNPLDYRWSRGGVPLSDNANITGSSSNVLTIMSVGAGDLGDYTVAASNACDIALSPPAALSLPSFPLALGPNFGDSTFQFHFATDAGVTYTIEYTEDLSSGVWTPLMTVEGDGQDQYVSDPWPVSASRFYRIHVAVP